MDPSALTVTVWLVSALQEDVVTEDLNSWVSRRLDEDDGLSDDAKLLIMAALDGDAALADMAGWTPPQSGPKAADTVEPVGAFLKQIKVRAFRGIGDEAQIDLDPGPSLTVISGRNGSGKSSFAEGLEVALTGSTFRWRNRTTQWKERWRNVHCHDDPRIEVTLVEEGVGRTRLVVDWPDDADLEAPRTTLQREGGKQEPGMVSLGWAGPLETYRPLLTYEELGALLAAAPADLYDKISTVLGIGQLSDAVRRLDAHQRSLSAPQVKLAKDKKDLLAQLEALDDERARQAAVLLKKRKPDAGQLRQLAIGSVGDTGQAAQVRALLRLRLPSEQECAEAADELKAAVGAFADLANESDAAAERRAQLVDAVIALHEHEGRQQCPVCGVGTVDGDLIATLRAERAAERSAATALRDARDRHQNAGNAARRLIQDPPAALSVDLPVELTGPAAATRTAWQDWASAPGDLLEFGEHIQTKRAPLDDALAKLQTATQQYVDELDDAWGAIATRIATFVDDLGAWDRSEPEASAAKDAHQWLKSNEIALKNERVLPIAEEAKRIWAGLRQQSNVDIAGLALEGSNTRRRVVVSAAVDGEDVGALSVMSQGELHSLALALFIPRATMPQSPFRFVVLDDPVQAMDPAKVDGLVNVLLEIARTRQVIVFSHDDRFASAVRRAPREVPVKVLEIRREANSKVTAVVALSPAQRYLRDAFAITKDEGLDLETLRRVLPGLLRMALEAQCREVYFTRGLSSGASHQEVEENWAAAMKTRARLGLAVADGADPAGWLNQYPHRRRALKHANAIHSQLESVAPIDACRDVERAVDDLVAGAR